MMKYIYLVLAIFCLCMFVYFFLANRLNRNLNIKKRQIAVSPLKNKYTKLMFISICMFFIFGMFFMVKIASRDYDELKTMTKSFDYQENLKLDKLHHQKIENSIEYSNNTLSLEDGNIVYFVNSNYIVKYDIVSNKNIKVLINEEYQILSIYQNNSYIVCIATNGDLTRVDIISKYDMSIKNTITIDGIFKASIISDKEFDLIIYNQALKESFKNGYRQNKNDKKYFDELMYIDCCSFDGILTHLKISFDGFKVEDLSFCVADEYFLFNQELYLFFNSFNGVDCNGKFYVIKYSYIDMEILNYKSYDGAIYSSPIIIDGKIFIVSKDIINNKFKRLKIDKYLNLLESDYIEIEKNNINNVNNIILNNEIINCTNVLIYNNKYLLSYRYDETFIYFKEYLIDMNATFEYKILINQEFNELNILNCFKENNKIIFTYKIDNSYGYYYIDIINEKYGSLSVFDSYQYFVTLNNIIYLDGNSFKER